MSALQRVSLMGCVLLFSLFAQASALPQLPEGRSGAALVSTEGALFLIGGRTKEGLVGAIDRLDFSAKKWTRVATEMVPRAHHRAVVVGEEIFIFGGRDDLGVLPDVEIFNVRTGHLRRGASMATPRAFFGAALYRGEIYIAGGTMGWGRLKSTEIYDPERDEWFIGQPLSEARDTELVVVGNELLALGGYTGSEVVGTVDRMREDVWTKIGDWPARSAFSAVVLGSSVFFIGDYRDRQRIISVRRLPLAKGGFRLGQAVKGFGSAHAAATTLGGRVFVVGGTDKDGSLSNRVRMFRPHS